MNRDDYNDLILKRIDISFNRMMPVVALVAWISAVVIFFSSIPDLFAIIDVIIGIIFIVMFVLKEKLSTEFKIFVTIIITLFFGILTFIDGGFSSGTVTLFLIGNSIAVLLLARRNSIIIAGVSLTILVMLWFWSKMNNKGSYIGGDNAIWLIQIMLFLLFIVIFQVVVYAIRKYLLENIKDLKQACETTYTLAYYDQLTSLPNLNLFKMNVSEKMKNKHLKGYFVLISLKTLNEINSIYGIEMGDKVLVETARCIQKVKGETDTIARVGGNEFLIWVDEEDWIKNGKNIDLANKSFFKMFNIKEVANRIEYYFCYAPYDSSKDNVEESLQKVNLALAYAKKYQKNHLVAYDKRFEERLRRSITLIELLRKTIFKRAFTINYQCKVNLLTGEIVGVEALARWHTEEYGDIGPSEFVPMTEEMNQSKAFGKIIFEKTFCEYEKLCKKYNENITLSINISPTFLMDDEFVEYIKQQVEKYKIPPYKIILEITEEIIILGLKEANDRLQVLRKYGIKISLDDFGSGYSSLNYLSALNVDEIKIDKTLIDSICIDDRYRILLEAILNLARKYQLGIVVEGVENQEQKVLLEKMGCNIIQGYYYDQPHEI